MKLHEILAEEICEDCKKYNEVYIDTNDNVYDDQNSFLGKINDFQIDEDWGSSDWSVAIKVLKKELNANVPLPDALENVAKEFNPPRTDQNDEWEYFSPEKLYDIAVARNEITEGGQINEASKRQWKRFGKELRKRYRCTSGPKQGKLVADPSQCASRKDPKKVRQGRKVMRTKKNTIARKSKIAKRTQLSKIVTRVNARLMGKKPTSGTSSGGDKQKSASTQKAKSTQKPKKPQ